MSCSEAEDKFQTYLYDFIAQRIPQESEDRKKKDVLSKTSAVVRAEAMLAKNKQQKRCQKKHVKFLKKNGCFYGDVAKHETRLWRRLLKNGNKLRKRLKQAKEHSTQRRANAKFRANPHELPRSFLSLPVKMMTFCPPKNGVNSIFQTCTKTVIDHSLTSHYLECDARTSLRPLSPWKSPQNKNFVEQCGRRETLLLLDGMVLVTWSTRSYLPRLSCCI